MRPVEIPGDIMQTTVIAGLTLKELGMLFGAPMILVLPSLYINQIPLSLSLGFVLVCMPIVGILIIQTPDGQSPISWIGALINRKITPDTYHLKPGERRQADGKYLNVVHTSKDIKNDSDPMVQTGEKPRKTQK